MYAIACGVIHVGAGIRGEGFHWRVAALRRVLQFQRGAAVIGNALRSAARQRLAFTLQLGDGDGIGFSRPDVHLLALARLIRIEDAQG